MDLPTRVYRLGADGRSVHLHRVEGLEGSGEDISLLVLRATGMKAKTYRTWAVPLKGLMSDGAVVVENMVFMLEPPAPEPPKPKRPAPPALRIPPRVDSPRLIAYPPPSALRE